ncbi:hypothetical protein [Thiomicrorhabdus cannonii]|uniref:hypothetical protein n=1 Tax=Thiomicrorhabdus cannonii TaxID=2748011 RepID=UPI0015BF8910|nr:hypothetical protein [Thiomicrorhabdus cannonii]
MFTKYRASISATPRRSTKKPESMLIVPIIDRDQNVYKRAHYDTENDDQKTQHIRPGRRNLRSVTNKVLPSWTVFAKR